MMWQTKTIYLEYQRGIRKAPDSFVAGMPVWETLDRLADSIWVRSLFALAYTAVYVVFAPSAWLYLLLPIQILIGPFHGAFVNWCGHRYGYASHDTGDNSKNTFPWDLLFMGETFQNNHHKFPNRANFATRWFECDMLYPMIWFLNKVSIIQLKVKTT